MYNENNTLALQADNLSGVAEVLERTDAKSIVTCGINGWQCWPDTIEIAERLLEHIHSRLSPCHPKLNGLILLTPAFDSMGRAEYNRLSISFDLLDADEAANMMNLVPHDMFHGTGNEFHLVHDWECLDASEAIRSFRLIEEAGGRDDAYLLSTHIEMHPYNGACITPAGFGRLIPLLGARPTIPGVQFLGMC